MNTKNYTRAELLEAQKAAILDCINAAETVEDREFYEGLLAKFSALHPEF